MATSSAIDTNISSLPAADQARTDVSTSGSTSTITVTGGPLNGLEATTSAEAPNLILDGSFVNSAFTGGGAFTEKFTVTSGNKISKSTINVGDDAFKDTINFGKNAKAKGVTIENFGQGDVLKYKGKVYTSSDVNGNQIGNISTKQIKLA